MSFHKKLNYYQMIDIMEYQWLHYNQHNIFYKYNLIKNKDFKNLYNLWLEYSNLFIQLILQNMIQVVYQIHFYKLKYSNILELCVKEMYNYQEKFQIFLHKLQQIQIILKIQVMLFYMNVLRLFLQLNPLIHLRLQESIFQVSFYRIKMQIVNIYHYLCYKKY